ncbi:MAG TPA: hypothetical protein VK973_13630 [Arenicellales bacterium]|nr:hypothetical protein [Arenicellales bacterium]
MPHHLFIHHRFLVLAVLVLSLGVSLWALYLDPVINMDGILYVEAAAHFARGEWTQGFAVYKWPFYSLLIGALSAVTGMHGGHAAYTLNAGLYVVLVLGFVAFVKVLGGSRRALWLAAFVGLLHPVLNEFRAFVIRDVGYWACYLWGLAFLLAYARDGGTRLLTAGVVAALAAFLFRIEGFALLAVLPAGIYAARVGGARAAPFLVPAALAAAAAAAIAPVWQYVSEVNVSTPDLLLHPLHHVAESWRLIGDNVAARLQALQREFGGLGTGPAALSVYAGTALAMMLIESIKSVGIVFTGLLVYGLAACRIHVPAPMRNWWLLAVAVQVLLVLQFGLTNFFLAERYPVALALTVLPVVPLALDDIWRRFGSAGDSRRWRAVLVTVLLVVESLEGLDVATGKHYIKDAGLWLRASAPPGSTLYSNNRILAYYAGLEKALPDARYTWEEAMQQVWTDNWRRHDYFALVMPAAERRNEVLLFQRLDAEPVKTFGSDTGDRVLIFRAP